MFLANTDIYPLSPSKKLYPIGDEGNYKYVKGGFGGAKIISSWEEKEDNQCYKLEGTEPLEYIAVNVCQDPSLFEVVSHENAGTANWKVTVFNNETNETTSNVYPFNLNGSLYQLPTGEDVIATCGGTNIEETWTDQQANEFYRLVGTGETIKFENKISFFIKYEYSTSPKYQVRWFENHCCWIQDANTGCECNIGSGYRDWMPSSVTNDISSFIMTNRLPWVRREYEIGFYLNFPEGYGPIRNTVICIINGYGYNILKLIV